MRTGSGGFRRKFKRIKSEEHEEPLAISRCGDKDDVAIAGSEHKETAAILGSEHKEAIAIPGQSGLNQDKYNGKVGSQVN